VKPLEFLVELFVNTFGITRPSPRQEKMAGWFIAGMLLLIVLGLTGLVWLVHHVLAH
jgi:hypothetical protein